MASYLNDIWQQFVYSIHIVCTDIGFTYMYLTYMYLYM